MEERSLTLENAYFRNVLNVIEKLLFEIPCPAHVQEKPGRKSITVYKFQEPVRKDDLEKQQGRISTNYSETTTTEFAIMAGLVLEKDPIVFECFQGSENSQVLVRGYCSAKKETAEWIQPIFDTIWQGFLSRY
jgi:hypothetical protein